MVVYYGNRTDSDYTGWGLHLWGDQVTNTSWGSPLQAVGVDPGFGAAFVINLAPGAAPSNCPVGSICVIAHKADLKDPGPDMSFTTATLGNLVFLTSGSPTLTSAPVTPGAVSIAGAAAHLLSADTLAWNVTNAAATTFELRGSLTAEIAATPDGDVAGGAAIPLTARAAGLTAAERLKYPHLAAWRAFDVAAADLPALEAALKGQLVAVARDAAAKPVQATQVQTAGALDDLYANTAPLGALFDTVAGAPTLALWAPTAQAVRLRVFDADAARTEVAGSPFTPVADVMGVWRHTGPAGWYGKYYQWELTVYHPLSNRIETVTTSDPYAVSLDVNGTRAQILDLDDPLLAPPGWAGLVKPALAAPEDIVLYESHIRDFSAFDQSTPAAHRGKYLGFTAASPAERSLGQQRLAALAAAGLTHVHLLPAFDIATVNEDPAARVDLGDPFATLCVKNPQVPVARCGQFAGQTVLEAMASQAGDSAVQQELADYVHLLDSFNWGYDPLHYGAPEGSYASTAEGGAKVLEFRQMVQGLADLGLRVVMDVVYNHTNASGLGDKAVLDKVVPGYYHRRNPETGFVESSSCCANTATEHLMMGRLMTDTLVRWARQYKVDGFRFDLMGLHLKADVLAARDALAGLTPAADGVDGSKLYLYGEGWNMGETANNNQGPAATQIGMAGTGIGTFNDRVRDAVRGGSAFDSGADLRKRQGFANGLVTDPNELAPATASAADDAAKLAEYADWIKAAMAGNLANFRLRRTGSGSAVEANAIGYNGARTAYTQDPQEAINYVSAHDNQVLFDLMQYRLPTGLPMADRVRAGNVALAVVGLGQGIPFFHMGDDLLRSKSMERDSYDSGDWPNRIDWTGASNGWRSGLPNAGKDQTNWPTILPIFADASIAPAASHIAAAAAHFEELLRVRSSSPLFRLRTKAEVLQRVDFLNFGAGHVPGVIVMTVADGTHASCAPALADLDPGADALVVIVNADKVAHDLEVPGAAGFVLHPVQAASADPVVRTAGVGASAAGQVFTVPGRTAAVFVAPQAAGQGAGLPCNTR
ncbi:MAG: pullulanase-type alpha-1,6-glucosidase [Anaeromyxobacter sp.]|nr:pullulanase-type alpha-1,6-glucosidase [Anaeromyxobacter sp.]